MGKKFVIMEVVEYGDYGPNEDGCFEYCPADNQKPSATQPRMEVMCLQPSRIIDGSRLRMGKPKEGELGFSVSATGCLGWINWGYEESYYPAFLILDPLPQTPMEKWNSECPMLQDGGFGHATFCRDMTAWLERMPKENNKQK